MKRTSEDYSWQLRLELANDPRQMLIINIKGAVVVGRDAEKAVIPDVDLSPFDAIGFGVSRQHAVILPTMSQIFIADLDSTNGTYINGIAVECGMKHVIRDNDMIRLGGLQFVVHVIDQPDESPGTPPSPLPSPVIDSGPQPAGSAHAQLHFEPDPDPLDADGRVYTYRANGDLTTSAAGSRTSQPAPARCSRQ